MSDLNDTIDTYLAAWSEQDDVARAELVGRVWADDGRLVDPPMAAGGHAEISGMHAALQGQFAGHAFHRASAVDAHHDACASPAFRVRGKRSATMLDDEGAQAPAPQLGPNTQRPCADDQDAVPCRA